MTGIEIVLADYLETCKSLRIEVERFEKVFNEIKKIEGFEDMQQTEDLPFYIKNIIVREQRHELIDKMLAIYKSRYPIFGNYTAGTDPCRIDREKYILDTITLFEELKQEGER